MGFVPQPNLQGLLRALDERRADWRGKRERGEVSLTDLMPLHTEAEHRWAYYVPQPIPADAIDKAPDSVRDLKILDPAVGSGHFLVVAFELLFALYLEEARHRGESDQEPWSDRAIVERILTHNLHGIDLDPRAVQIAAAALWLKARRTCPQARPARLNLVASNLRLAGLPDTDPALVELRLELERETGIPARLTDTLIHALAGADHLGSLLKIDAAVEDAIARHEAEASRQPPAQLQLSLEPGAQAEPQATPVGAAPRRDLTAGRAPDRDRAKADILDRLETFLAHHTRGEDLGLRLHGEQLAAGVRFLRMLKEGSYHLVVGNPPYQGTSKMADADYVKRHYPLGKADLYAAFLIRGLQLARKGGTSALLTMRNWMFIKQYAEVGISARSNSIYERWGFRHWCIRSMDNVISSCNCRYSQGTAGHRVSAWPCSRPRLDDHSMTATTRVRGALLSASRSCLLHCRNSARSMTDQSCIGGQLEDSFRSTWVRLRCLCRRVDRDDHVTRFTWKLHCAIPWQDLDNKNQAETLSDFLPVVTMAILLSPMPLKNSARSSCYPSWLKLLP